MMVVVEHASAIATGMQITDSIASDRLTITSASSNTWDMSNTVTTIAIASVTSI